MKGWKKKVLGLFLAVILTAMGAVPGAAAHPQVINVMTTYPEGWTLHYPDGHTSKGGYFHVRETGERLFCLEPQINPVMSTRDHWVTLTQYFGDAAFAKKLSLTAWYGENSGWGLNGWAAAQSLIWKYIMQRNGTAGEQWISTDTLTSREKLQPYYDAIEQKVAAYNKLPSFDRQTITLQAGQSTELTDTNGALSDMKVESSGPIQVSKDGNKLTITASGTDGGTGTVSLKKQLSGGREGENFVYTAEEYQDLMTCGEYAPVRASLTVDVTDAPVSMVFSKQDVTTGQELPGAKMQVTDWEGRVVDAWTSGTEPHRIQNLKKGGVYTLTETIPAPGYATAQSVRFMASHGAEPVVMRDEVTKIQVSKKDVTTGQELPGATLQVTDRDGKVVDRWISGTAPHMLTKLVAGETYTLTETIPAPGYATARSVTFTVADTESVQKVEMGDDITRVEVSKTDLTTGQELPGATLQVTDKNGKVVDRWVSGKMPHSITKLVAGETYTLTETLPAAGYVTAKAVTFRVSDTGTVQKVQMKDDVTKVEVSKTDLTTGQELPGATLQVTDKNGKVVDRWVSGKMPHSITKLVAGETYTLTETLPAAGYVTAKAVTFRVSDTGTVQKVQMKDDVTKVEVSKTDLTTGQELPGATLQVTDKDGKVVDRWVSGETPHSITKLIAGETYTLTETLPAAGYVTAEAVTFTVKDTGIVQKVQMKDDITKIRIQKTGLSMGGDPEGPEEPEKPGTDTEEKDLKGWDQNGGGEAASGALPGEAADEEEIPEGLSGASLQVTDASGTVIDRWVTDGKPHALEKLIAGGTYILTEVSPAEGFATAEPIEFTVEDTGEIQWIVMEDDITKVEISKKDLTDGKELPGAVLRVTDEEGELVEEWISGEEPHRITGLVAGKTYTLTETIPAHGYTTAEAVTFMVKDTGEVQKVSMEDDITKVEISKRDLTDGKELPGAALRVTDEEGKLVEEWISGEEPHRITGLAAGKTYTLTETHPADGYVTAEAVTFTVKDTGEPQKVIMEDDITRTEVSKVDVSGGKVLAGALLQIIDSGGNVVCEWTSQETPLLIEKLIANETYVLHEEEAPEGYLTAEDVEFTVSDTGEVQTVAIEDELAVIKLEVAKRTIRRTQTGDTYKYTITTLKNASNTALENFTCADHLPEQVVMRELHTGTFSDELEYSIAYQTNRSEEWHPLAKSGVPIYTIRKSFFSIYLHYLIFREINQYLPIRIKYFRFGNKPFIFSLFINHRQVPSLCIIKLLHHFLH